MIALSLLEFLKISIFLLFLYTDVQKLVEDTACQLLCAINMLIWRNTKQEKKFCSIRYTFYWVKIILTNIVKTLILTTSLILCLYNTFFPFIMILIQNFLFNRSDFSTPYLAKPEYNSRYNFFFLDLNDTYVCHTLY